MTRPARRAISELLPEDAAAAAVEFIRIGESKHAVIVQDIQHRSTACRFR